jgi:tRNA pseudouridine38-40 synthase
VLLPTYYYIFAGKMARYKLFLEFDGSRYYGWQAQKGQRTVQGEFFNVFDQLFPGKAYEFYGAGRTDSGVHALGQVAHLDMPESIPTVKLQIRINDLLPPDIHVLFCEKAHARFHARHDAEARSYIYQISRRRTAFEKSHCWWVKDFLDAGAMQTSAKVMEGRHDFRSFTEQSPEEGSTLVEIQFIDIYESEELISIHITGSHFLWKMVRRIVGILVETGRHKIPVHEVYSYLESYSPVPAQHTAPPSGLFLHRVYYPGDKILRGGEHMPQLLNLH